MGIAFIASKQKGFKHRTDQAYEERLKGGDLLTAIPDSIKTTYRCQASSEKLPEPGTKIVVDAHKTPVKVYLHNKLIGTVLSPDGAEILDALIALTPPVSAAVVTEAHSMSGLFMIELLLPRR